MLVNFDNADKENLNEVARDFYQAKKTNQFDREEKLLQELSILLYRFLLFYSKSKIKEKFIREDFVSYAYIKIIEILKKDELKETIESDFCKYAYVCMKNIYLNYIKSHKDRLNADSLDVDAYEDGTESKLTLLANETEEDVVSNIYVEHILENVLQLVKNDKKREILNYYFLEKIINKNISLKELAEIMKVSPSYITRITKEFDNLIEKVIREDL